jgi:amidohydrolase
MEGTIRTHEAAVRAKVLEQFQRIVEHTALAHGATAQIACSTYGPPTWNDPELGKRMRPTLVRLAGEGSVIEVEPSMGGEDFAHFAQKKPGFYCFLGVRNKAVASGGLHTPNLVLDEAALPLGVRSLSMLAIEFLSQK